MLGDRDRTQSRYAYAPRFVDGRGNVRLMARVPFRYRAFDDTVTHTVNEGDSLFTLAGHYYAPMPRACGYWWAIADFQPEPIIDGTLALPLGSQIYVPSARVLVTLILADPETWPS